MTQKPSSHIVRIVAATRSHHPLTSDKRGITNGGIHSAWQVIEALPLAALMGFRYLQCCNF